MNTIAFVSDPNSVGSVVEWARVLSTQDGSISYVALDDSLESQTKRQSAQRSDWPSLEERVSRANESATVQSLLDLCRQRRTDRLITTDFVLPDSGTKKQSPKTLLRSAPCEAIVALNVNRMPSEVRSILVTVTGGGQDLSVVRLADKLRRRFGAQVTIATVEQASGERAERAGERAIQTLLHDALLDEDDFESRVVVNRSIGRGILKCVDSHELILFGMDAYDEVAAIRDKLTETTTIVVKRAPPLRFRSIVDWLPRINPKDHADLLQDLRRGSRLGADFVLMLVLASGIATLGLLQNSPAVVIGSMLLAPLMTPMIGAGLAIAQANLRLARMCGKSIMFGFAITLLVSFVLAFIIPGRETLAPEVLSRGGPNILDLMIALMAAVAATYAMVRPNIAGAIAGVAIATALVPPVCAVGISLAEGAFTNAIGAALLFLANLVAIIVASSYTFTLLGVSTTRALPVHRTVLRLVRVAFLILLLLLSGPLSLLLVAQFREGRRQTAVYPVTRATATELKKHVEKDDDIEITFLGQSSVTGDVVIHIASSKEIPESYAKDLREIVRSEMGDQSLGVYVVALDGQWLSGSDKTD